MQQARALCYCWAGSPALSLPYLLCCQRLSGLNSLLAPELRNCNQSSSSLSREGNTEGLIPFLSSLVDTLDWTHLGGCDPLCPLGALWTIIPHAYSRDTGSQGQEKHPSSRFNLTGMERHPLMLSLYLNKGHWRLFAGLMSSAKDQISDIPMHVVM